MSIFWLKTDKQARAWAQASARRQLTDIKQWQHPISSRDASQSTAQSNQSIQEQVSDIFSGKNSSGSQNTTTDDLPGVGGNVEQAYKGLEDLHF